MLQAITDYFDVGVTKDDLRSIITYYFSVDPVKSAPTADLESDKESLTAIYHATGGPDWVINSGWLSGSPVDQWHGVTVNHCGLVTKLVLHNNELSGPIPAGAGQPHNPGNSDTGP